jgi:hypothetical protein
MPVADTPNGDTNTLRNIQASLGDSLVVTLLLSELGAIDWSLNSDIKFGDSDVKTSIAQALELSFNATDLADNKVALGTNTVNGSSSVPQALNQCELG